MEDMADIAGMDMSMPAMPTWVRVMWAAALAIALIAHLRHILHMSGQHGWWLLGHAVMGTAMIPMYMPELVGGKDLTVLGSGLFLFAALAVAATTIAMRYRENVVNPLWVILATDLAIMAYMWLPMANRRPVLDSMLVGYFIYQIAAWSLDLWNRIPVLERSTPGGRHTPKPAPTVAMVGLTAHTSVAGRATSVVMAASMGYMLWAM